jgi:hypothetical protein
MLLVYNNNRSTNKTLKTSKYLLRTILVEKHEDFTFDTDSQATLRINSIVLPDLILDGTRILDYPLYMKPISGDLSGIDINCRLTPEMIMRGVVLLGAYIDGDNIRIGINGKCRIPENLDAFRISFFERIQIRSIKPIQAAELLVNTLKEMAELKAPKKRKK